MRSSTNKISAVVLHTLKYRDTSVLVDAYTDLFGRQTYLVNGVRSAKNKAGMACFQALSLLDAVAYHRPKNDIQRLKEYYLSIPLQNLAFNVHKNAIAVFMGEVVYKTVREQEPNEQLFRFLRQSVLELENIEEGTANYHLYFLARLAAYLGFASGNDYKPEHTYFDISSGEFTIIRPKHELFFDAEQTALFGRLLKAEIADLPNIGLHHSQRSTFVNNILRFYEHHFDALSPICSWTVLGEVYA
ncbi:MAG: recombination protein O N-terminal domain-containing protein [Prevotellaceae bacterium]|jgi:DNA repair protein RecO (recombination protein O)|nr:recombination protein O N-terminal domain-containing protein [Prevotellaceae bacterium]